MIFSNYEIRGIDISTFNDDCNLIKVKESGITFIGIRVGYGNITDNKFKTFWHDAKLAGLERMPYWYLDYYSFKTLGITETEWGYKQAENAWALLKDDVGECPLMLDMENCTGSYGWAVTHLTKGSFNKVSRAFLTRFDALSGGKACIYCSPGFLPYLNSWHKDRNLWIAWYNESKTIEQVKKVASSYSWTGKVLMWQYASHGDMNQDGVADGKSIGLSSDFVDLNIWLGTVEEWSIFCGNSTGTNTPPITEDPVEISIPTSTKTKTVELFTVVASSGLNIRSKTSTSSTIVGWMEKGREIEVLEKIIVGTDIWARIGQGQYCAMLYNGNTYLI